MYVVATPIGNLGDITARAVDVLREVAAIAAEDTRHTQHLLDHLGLRKPMFALFEHNEMHAVGQLMGRLDAGQSVALVCDAGTPGISDPGGRAVAEVRRAGYRIVPIPGPSAAIAALSVAGLVEQEFHFAGFLPTGTSARRRALEGLGRLACALVFYESPHRIVDSVGDMLRVLGGAREILICREITKLFESIERMPLREAPGWLDADEHRRRGEFVLVVGGAEAEAHTLQEGKRLLRLLLPELPLKSAARVAAAASGASKKLLYAYGLDLKGRSDGLPPEDAA